MKTKILLLGLLLAFPGWTRAAVQVVYTGNVVDAAGTGVADGNEVRIGYFSTGFDVAANAGNLSALQQHWVQFGSTMTANGPPLPPRVGNFDGVSNGDPTTFGGHTIYLWAFQTGDHAPPASNFANVQQYGLFNNPSSSDWVFPSNDGTSTAIDSGQPGVQAVFGHMLGGSLQLAPVPDPAQFAAVSMLLMLLLAAGARRPGNYWLRTR